MHVLQKTFFFQHSHVVTRQIACYSEEISKSTAVAESDSSTRDIVHTHAHTLVRAHCPSQYPCPSAYPPQRFSPHKARPEETDQQQLQQEQAVAGHQRASLSHAADRQCYQMAIYYPSHSRASDVTLFESKWDKKSPPGNPADRSSQRQPRERKGARERERERRSGSALYRPSDGRRVRASAVNYGIAEQRTRTRLFILSCTAMPHVRLQCSPLRFRARIRFHSFRLRTFAATDGLRRRRECRVPVPATRESEWGRSHGFCEARACERGLPPQRSPGRGLFPFL